MKRPFRLIALVVPITMSSVAAWVGCSGDDGGTVDDKDAAPESGTIDSGGGVDTGRPDTSTGNDSGGTDAGTDAATDAALDAPIDAPPSTPGKITCGTATSACDAGEAVCCIDFLDAGDAATTQCISDTLACPGDSRPFDCDQRLDCGDAGNTSDQCCFEVGPVGDPGFGGATCKPNCNNGNERQLCKTNAECGVGGTCTFYTCKGYRIGTCGTLPNGLCN